MKNLSLGQKAIAAAIILVIGALAISTTTATIQKWGLQKQLNLVAKEKDMQLEKEKRWWRNAMEAYRDSIDSRDIVIKESELRFNELKAEYLQLKEKNHEIIFAMDSTELLNELKRISAIHGID